MKTTIPQNVPEANKSDLEKSKNVAVIPRDNSSDSRSYSNSINNPLSPIINEGVETEVADQDRYLHGIPLALCLCALVLSMFLCDLDQTISFTILTKVGNKFNGYSKIGWIISAFLLPVAVLTPTWGRLSIIFGRKPIMLIAILIFEFGSLICAVSTSMDMLIVGRAIAGVGDGGIEALIMIVSSEILPMQKRGIWFAALSVSTAVSTICGPLIGGAFTSHVSWRWCFYINLPIGGIAAIILFFGFHPTKPKGSIKDKLYLVDYIGTFLVSSGFVVLLLAITFGGNDYPWKSAPVIICFVLGGITLLVFCFYNFKISKQPLFHIEVLKIPQVLAASLVVGLANGYLMAYLPAMISYFQIVLNKTAIEAGIALLPTILAVVIAGVTTGIIATILKKVKPLVILSTTCALVGFSVITLLKKDSTSSEKIGYLILPGVGLGMTFSLLILSCQLAVPKDIKNGMILATTFLAFLKFLGGCLCSSISQSIFTSTLSYRLSSNKITNLLRDNDIYKIDIKLLINKPETIRSFPTVVANAILEEVTGSVKAQLLFCLGLSCAAFVCGIFTTNKSIQKSEENDNEQIKNENSISQLT